MLGSPLSRYRPLQKSVPATVRNKLPFFFGAGGGAGVGEGQRQRI